MSLQSRLGAWWARFHLRRKPPGEDGLVEFTHRRFGTPGWLVWMHSLGIKIELVESPVRGEWIYPIGAMKSERVIYYLHGGGYMSGSAKSCRPITATLARQLNARVFG